MRNNRIFSLDKIVSNLELQKILDGFAQATGVTSVIVDTDGKQITKSSNLPNLCMKLTRERDIEIIDCRRCDLKGIDNEKKHVCYAGLKEFSHPIVLNDRPIATLLSGRIFLEKPKKEKILKMAKKIGISKEEFCQYIDKIPVFSKNKAELISKLLSTIATYISQLAYQKICYEHEIKMLTLLEKIGEAINSKTELKDILDLIFEKSKEVIDYDCFSIQLLDEATQTLKPKASYGLGKEILENSEFKDGEGYAGWVLKNKKPFFTGDAKNEEIKIKYNKLVSKCSLKSFIVVPLMIEKRMFGAFIFGCKKVNAYSNDDIKPTTIIANQAAIAYMRN